MKIILKFKHQLTKSNELLEQQRRPYLRLRKVPRQKKGRAERSEPSDRQGHDAAAKKGGHVSELGDTEGETEQKEDNGKENGYSVKHIVAKLKRLNFYSSGNNDLMLDAQSGENLDYGL